MIGDVEYSEDVLIRRQGLGEGLSVSKLRWLPQVNVLFRTAGTTAGVHARPSHLPAPPLGVPAGAWRVCISRESNPGHIDGNDVFYH